MDYTTLVADKTTDGSIKQWMNYGLLPVTTLLEEAQTELYRRLRVREMKSEATISVTSGSKTASLPTNFIDAISLHYRDGSELVKKSERDIITARMYDETAGDYVSARMGKFAVFDELLQFDYRADQAYSLTMIYYKQPALLSGSNTTNFLTSRYPRLLRIACIRSAAEFMNNDTKFAQMEESLVKALAEIDVMDDMSQLGVDPSAEYRHG